MGSDYLTSQTVLIRVVHFLFKQSGAGSGNVLYCTEGGVAAIVADDYCDGWLEGHPKC